MALASRDDTKCSWLCKLQAIAQQQAATADGESTQAVGKQPAAAAARAAGTYTAPEWGGTPEG